MRWHRLTEMSPQEIGYRLYKELAFRFDKWQAGRGNTEYYDDDFVESFGLEWINLQPELSLQNLRRYIRDTVGGRFYFNPARQSEYLGIVEQRFPQWVVRAKKRADAVCQHRFQLLGLEEMHLGENIDWMRSPETGKLWPQIHWIDIDLSAPQAAGDPKIVWELNRHQQLLWLGLAYCYTRDESYVNEYLYQIESWIEQNPYQIGINWASSLEIAFRAINWIWALAFFINSPRLHNSSLLKIVKSLILHLEAISRNPSIYTSPNTHLIGEACALYIGGLLFEEQKSSKRWRKFGAQILKTELERQIFKDGAHKEQSAYYHAYTVEFYLLAEILARRNGETIEGRGDDSALARACEYLMHICKPGRELTSFGDEDGGKILMFDRTNYGNPSDLLATAAVLYRRSDFKYFSCEFHEATLWLLGCKGLERYDELASSQPRQKSIGFGDSGHVALRGDWSPDANYMLFHCPHMTHLPGHSHADCLSFEMSSGGRSRVIDSGTYRYNDRLEVRNYFRGTSAHNTVRIDYRDQSEPKDTFKWQRQARAQLLYTVFSPAGDYLYAEHNGYLALPNPCLHRRAVLFARPDYFVIWDEFTGNGEHNYESFFHFGDARLEQTEKGMLSIVYEDDLRLLVVPVADTIILADLVPVSDKDTGGWYSRLHGCKEHCLSLRLQRRAATPTTMMTILIPYRDREPEVESKIPGRNAICSRIKTVESEDIIICSLKEADFSGIFNLVDFKGKHLLLRTWDDEPRSVLGIGTSRIEYDGDLILNNSTSLSHFTCEEDRQRTMR
jgi:hypothetical protein